MMNENSCLYKKDNFFAIIWYNINNLIITGEKNGLFISLYKRRGISFNS